MMTTANHILAKEGILTTFSIAKKVNAKDINKLRKKVKDAQIDAEKLHEMLRDSVMEETQKALKSRKIPGLTIEGEEDTEEQKRLMELTYFASMVAKKLTDKKIEKYHSCYIINAIINMLGLTGDDFDDFHKKFSKFKNRDGGPEGNEGEPPTPPELGSF